MWPGLQCFGGHTTTTGLRFSFGPTIKQGYSRATPGQPFGSKRARRAGSNNQRIKLVALHQMSLKKFRVQALACFFAKRNLKVELRTSYWFRTMINGDSRLEQFMW